MKKFLASLLAVAMMFTMVTPAMATEAVPQAPTETGYDGKALPAAPLVNGDTITVTPDNAQYTLDGAYGSINGKTIHFSAGDYKDVLVLNRPTKYAGSETQYFNGSWNKKNSAAEMEKTGIGRYGRTVENVTFTADAKAMLAGFSASSGHMCGTKDNPAYDYVRETTTDSTVNSHYDYCSLKNILFKDMNFSGGVTLNCYMSDDEQSKQHLGEVINSGIRFEGCTFKGDPSKMSDNRFVAVKMGSDQKYFSDVTVENCTITNYHQGVYVQGGDGLVVRNNVIDNTTHNAIAIQSSTSNPTKGQILIEENVIKNAKDRAIRFGEASTAERIIINNNFMINSGDDKGELIKAQSIPTDASVMNLDNNYWNGKDAAEVVQTFTPPTKVGVISGTFGCDVKPYLPADLTQDENGNVVALTESNAVAQVGDKYYKDFYDAVEAAKNGGTVKLLQSTTVDTWNQVWNAKGLTIDGNGKTLTVNAIESNGNGNFLFYGAENLNVSNLTVNLPTQGYYNGFSMVSGKLENVTVNGGVYAVATGKAPEGQRVEIKNSTFSDQSGMAIYTQENGLAADTVIDGCTFNSERAMILRNNEQFTNNTVHGASGVTIDRGASATVTDNTFTETARLKIYETDSKIEQNKLLGKVVLDKDVPEKDSKISLNKNYWGENRTPETVLGKDNAAKVDGGNTNYYEEETMQPEDLNTYEPSTGGVVTRYDVTLADTDNGTITATHKRASKNSTVTITATPDEGYVVDAVTVTEKDGDKVNVTKKDDNKYTFKMPASDVTVKATFKVAPTEPEQPSGLPFTDVAKDAWYFPAVEYVFNNGLMNGTTATTFAPNVNLNRAMMAAVLYNMEGGPACDKSGLFSDVADGKWYTDAVNWAASNNIVSGMPDGTYAPDQALTREQMASILYRYAEYKGIDVSSRADLSTFTDGTTVSPWAQDVVQWAVAEKLMSGNGNELQPKGTASRAQVATVLMNYCENVAK